MAILCVFLPKWYMGEKLELGDSFAVMTIIFLLFSSINGMSTYSMQTLGQSFAVMARMGEVFRLEEYQRTRSDEPAAPGEPSISIENGEYAWGFRVADNQDKA